MRYFQTFKVKGNCKFPLDMLRYDACHPKSESDSGLMDVWPHERTVTLARQVEFKDDLPTAKRWESFGWKVVTDSVETRRI